ncbi:outer membrane protein assembly factor BamC [Veronia pacifica]|uniref:Outer membrane protein assembly factor BamC n=1 Tax=Veronia pacifica TaxID=1080227 RepID=A0A1C3EEL7_9GAMM|nr:outer membrane protein assembly factor BamC [Veronia pacifica]ODA31681.1 hypothetical protein A8L45_15670 [Veronia pacifica]
MKSMFKLPASALIISLAGCAGGVDTKHQAKDDFSYLKTPPLIELTPLPDQKPSQPSIFSVPQGNFPGDFGSRVDIRPPLQVLGTIPGSRIKNDGRGVTVWVDTEKKSDRLWDTVTSLATDKAFPVVSQQSETIKTDWISWPDSGSLKVKYEVDRLSANKRYGLSLTVTDWQGTPDGKVPDKNVRQRYNATMANLITEAYDKNVRIEARQRAVAMNKNIPMTLGKDRGGLPVIIARAPYDIVWERLPGILELIGFSVEYRNRSQGTINAEFEAPNEQLWQNIGDSELEFKRSKYVLLLGDLGNRTSINVTDAKGKPISEQALSNLVPVLSAGVSRQSDGK